MTRRAFVLWITTLVVSLLTAVWSYIFADPNFLLITHPAYVSFQRFMLTQQSNFWLRSPTYLILIIVWFALSTLWIRWIEEFSPRMRVVSWLSIIGVLLLGHNALSHDIFNYLFNAKMVVVYHSDPHIKTALDFASDPWVRFMHNVHTPAPYGRAWTAVSLIPYFLGLGKFALSYLSMRVWMALGLLLTVVSVAQLEKRLGKSSLRFWQLAWNPLVLLEVCLNGHNDVWMLWPALVAILLLLQTKLQRATLARLLLSAALFVSSLSQKYVTVVLLPLLPFLLKLSWPRGVERVAGFIQASWPELAALALLVPLVTARSQQFHPWYLVWALCFLPLIQWRWLRCVLVGLSIASLLRYIPWLENSLEYTPVVLALQKSITATGAVAGLLMWWKTKKYYPKR